MILRPAPLPAKAVAGYESEARCTSGLVVARRIWSYAVATVVIRVATRYPKAPGSDLVEPGGEVPAYIVRVRDQDLGLGGRLRRDVR